MNRIKTDISVTKDFADRNIQDRRRFPLTIAFLMGFLIVSGGRIHELFPVLLVIPIGDLTGGGALICFIFEAAKNGLGKISLLKEEKYVIGILILGIVTIPTSVWPGGCVQFLTGSYLKILVLFFLVTMAVRTVRDLRGMVWAYLVSVFFIGLMSVKRELARGSDIMATYDSNDIALVMVCAIPFAFYFFKENKLSGKIFVGAILFLALQAVVMSTSRGGFLGLVAIGLFFLFKAERNKRAIIFIATIVGVIVIFQIAPASYWERISGMWNPQNEYDASGGGRLHLWKTGLDIFIHNIFTGVGISNYTTADGLSHVDAGGKWATAHNSFIQIGVELGVVGFILFILLTFGTVLKMRRLQKAWQDKSEYQEMMWLTYAIEVGMCGYIVCGLFLSAAYFYYLYFFIGLSVAMQRIARNITNKSELKGKLSPLKNTPLVK